MNWSLYCKNHSKSVGPGYTALLSFLLVVGGASTSQAMNFFISTLTGVTGVLQTKPVRELTKTAVSYFEVEKTHGDKFNEAVSSMNRESTELIVQEVLDAIREDLKSKNYNSNEILKEKYDSDSIVKNYCDAFYVWHSRYKIAWLVLDYIEAFCKECDEATKRIKIYMPEEKNPIIGMKTIKEQNQKLQLQQSAQYFQAYLDEISAKKLNIGALLYARYRYTRGGGMLERGNKSYIAKSLRLERWGVDNFPKPSFSLTPECLFVSSSKTLKEEDKILNRIREIYAATLNVLTVHELVALGQFKQFQKTFSEVFSKHQLTPYKLKETIFEEIFEEIKEVDDEKKEIDTSGEHKGDFDEKHEDEKQTLFPKKSSPIDIPQPKNSNYTREKGSYGTPKFSIFNLNDDRQMIFGEMSPEMSEFEEKKVEVGSVNNSSGSLQLKGKRNNSV